MERQLEERPRSAWPPLRRKSSWPAALVAAASILSSCFLLTAGQRTTTPIQIVLQPPHPAEGQNVTLTLNPGDTVEERALLCEWYRGLTTDRKKLIFTYFFSSTTLKLQYEHANGAAFTGRVTAGLGCSLHIRNLTSEDTGNYTVNLEGPGIRAIGSASLVVSGLPNPDLVPSNVSIAPGIIVGSLAVTALVVGTLLYFFFRARGRRDKASTQTTAAPSVYDVSPSRQVKIDSSADSRHIYQTLEHADQSVYQQLEGNRQVSQPISLS